MSSILPLSTTITSFNRPPLPRTKSTNSNNNTHNNHTHNPTNTHSTSKNNNTRIKTAAIATAIRSNTSTFLITNQKARGLNNGSSNNRRSPLSTIENNSNTIKENNHLFHNPLLFSSIDRESRDSSSCSLNHNNNNSNSSVESEMSSTTPSSSSSSSGAVSSVAATTALAQSLYQSSERRGSINSSSNSNSNNSHSNNPLAKRRGSTLANRVKGTLNSSGSGSGSVSRTNSGSTSGTTTPVRGLSVTTMSSSSSSMSHSQDANELLQEAILSIQSGTDTAREGGSKEHVFPSPMMNEDRAQHFFIRQSSSNTTASATSAMEMNSEGFAMEDHSGIEEGEEREEDRPETALDEQDEREQMQEAMIEDGEGEEAMYNRESFHSVLDTARQEEAEEYGYDNLYPDNHDKPAEREGIDEAIVYEDYYSQHGEEGGDYREGGEREGEAGGYEGYENYPQEGEWEGHHGEGEDGGRGRREEEEPEFELDSIYNYNEEHVPRSESYDPYDQDQDQDRNSQYSGSSASAAASRRNSGRRNNFEGEDYDGIVVPGGREGEGEPEEFTYGDVYPDDEEAAEEIVEDHEELVDDEFMMEGEDGGVRGSISYKKRNFYSDEDGIAIANDSMDSNSVMLDSSMHSTSRGGVIYEDGPRELFPELVMIEKYRKSMSMSMSASASASLSTCPSMEYTNVARSTSAAAGEGHSMKSISLSNSNNPLAIRRTSSPGPIRRGSRSSTASGSACASGASSNNTSRSASRNRGTIGGNGSGSGNNSMRLQPQGKRSAAEILFGENGTVDVASLEFMQSQGNEQEQEKDQEQEQDDQLEVAGELRVENLHGSMSLSPQGVHSNQPTIWNQQRHSPLKKPAIAKVASKDSDHSNIVEYDQIYGESDHEQEDGEGTGKLGTEGVGVGASGEAHSPMHSPMHEGGSSASASKSIRIVVNTEFTPLQSPPMRSRSGSGSSVGTLTGRTPTSASRNSSSKQRRESGGSTSGNGLHSTSRDSFVYEEPPPEFARRYRRGGGSVGGGSVAASIGSLSQRLEEIDGGSEDEGATAHGRCSIWTLLGCGLFS